MARLGRPHRSNFALCGARGAGATQRCERQFRSAAEPLNRRRTKPASNVAKPAPSKDKLSGSGTELTRILSRLMLVGGAYPTGGMKVISKVSMTVDGSVPVSVVK